VLWLSAAEALEHEWLAVEGAANDMLLQVRTVHVDVTIHVVAVPCVPCSDVYCGRVHAMCCESVLRPSAAEVLEHAWLAVEGAANDMPLKVRTVHVDVVRIHVLVFARPAAALCTACCVNCWTPSAWHGL
jgi:hypothetical protein